MTLSNTSTMWFPPSEDIMTIVPPIRALVKSFETPPSSSPLVAKAEVSLHSLSETVAD
jgi:hypothetical protein